jgi:hypothetical protein
VPRSTFYYQPRPESPENLRLLRKLDELYLIYPFFGSRRMAVKLAVGRTRTRRLMSVLGIEAHYPKRNLSRPALGHEIYPYLLRGVSISMDGRGRALGNVFIERLWRSLKYELVYPGDFVRGPICSRHCNATSISTITSARTRRSATARRPIYFRASQKGRSHRHNGGPPGRPAFPKNPFSAPERTQKTRYATPRHLQIGLDQPRKPLSRTRLNLLCFDGRLVTTAASSGRRPRVKHRNIQQQNTKR